MNDLKYWIGLSKTGLIGAMRFKKLISYFADIETAYNAPYAELIKAGIEPKVAEELVNKRNIINPDLEYEKMLKEDIKAMTVNDEKYPKLLSQIFDAPPIIYYKGNETILNNSAIAVVGSRKVSAYGQQATPFIVRDLVQNGLDIVSGMALGIDAIAHSTALEAGGKTVAVLGSGLDRDNIYPSYNRYLFQKIINSGGVVISEHPVGTPPLSYHFPMRNRIISGLSLGVLVVEASQRSGSLITARMALEQNREVFAVPGSIFNQNSEGTNDLIKKGAHPVTSASDILEILNFRDILQSNKKISFENEIEEKIFSMLTDEPSHIDVILRNVKISASELSSTLMLMEMRGIVKNLGGSRYVVGR